MRALNPDNVVKPASNYVQAVVHRAAAERIVISGQLGLAPDGTLAHGLEAQMEQAWNNVFGERQGEINYLLINNLPGHSLPHYPHRT